MIGAVGALRPADDLTVTAGGAGFTVSRQLPITGLGGTAHASWAATVLCTAAGLPLGFVTMFGGTAATTP